MDNKLNHSLRELAQLAGVSKSTASRVISGNGYASPEVRERVLKAVEQLRYKPSAVARAMVAKRTHNIGVIVFRDRLPIVSHTLYGRIIDEILMAAEALGYSIFLKTDREMSLRSTDYMLEQRVDGLILVSRLQKNVIDYVKNFNIPYLMVNGSTEDPDVVHLVSNDEAGGERAAEHLYACGHRKFFIIAGPGEHRSHSLRLGGFRKRLESLGICSGRDGFTIVESSESSFDSGRKLMEEHYAALREGRYSALFSTNDMLALGAMKVLLERGVRIPQEVSVMGYDNTEVADMYHPSLTTVSVDASGIGRDAVSILDRLISGEGSVPRLIEYESVVIVRQSTNGKEDGTCCGTGNM
ncbi:LacI family DNA-binding transcriptional regulator [Paenibacillus pabuli]|uniref:LacI family DNA-binding transcriptional regulator n=1 Tax=Paenibacillus pabuli TaxID=1472 RepID=UPI00078426A0|nr:LacI family DNA-binding transcriptional regulator [Paenibacillus pabuli]